MIRGKDLVKLLNISSSYASDILKGKKGISEENKNKMLKEYPDIRFRVSNKPRYKIILDKENKNES